MAEASSERIPSPRQMRFFHAENPLPARLGQAFFRSLPRHPGVYFFRDEADKILYVGQSHDLRKRVGSYRQVHPDRHPRRLVRLVHAVAKIDWELCPTPQAAVERESSLLVELRPSFNRMGVWIPPPWWVTLASAEGSFEARLVRQIPAGTRAIGPLPSAYRHVHEALVRCLFRWLHPAVPLCQLPAGILGEKAARTHRWTPASLPSDLCDLVESFVLRKDRRLLELLQSLLVMEQPVFEQQYWAAAMDLLETHAGKPPYQAAEAQVGMAPPPGQDITLPVPPRLLL